MKEVPLQEKTYKHKWLKGMHYFARYLLLCLSICLCMIASLYGISNLICLRATNIYCPVYTEEQVRRHNFKNGSPKGDFGVASCWYIDTARFDFQAILEPNSKLLQAHVDQFSTSHIIQCAIYFIVILYPLYVIIWYGFYLFYDTFYLIFNLIINGIIGYEYKHDKNVVLLNMKHNPRITNVINETRRKLHHAKALHRRKKHKRTSKGKIQNRNNSLSVVNSKRLCCCVNWIYIKWIEKYEIWKINYFYYDSKWRLFWLMGKEWMEIFIQIYGLFLYGGIDLFDKETNILGQNVAAVRGKR